MLSLMFQLDEDRYALDAAQIVEVLPLVTVKKTPRAPHGLAGYFNYRGGPVPLVDLAELMLGRPTRAHLSSRIILTSMSKKCELPQLIGLLAENVTEIIRREPSDLISSGIGRDGVSYLGPILTFAGDFVQCIQVDMLLPKELLELLTGQLVERA